MMSRHKSIIMSRLVFYLILSCLFTLSHAQPENANFIKVYGKILNQDDSSAVAASVTYEKLPYFDDIGITTSGVDGEFEFYLAEGMAYTFLAEKKGFNQSNKEVVIQDLDKDGLFIFTMLMEPGEENELISLENLIFASGNDKITESSYEELDQLVSWLKDRPNTIIQLEGHTDFAGNLNANMKLSQSRVDATKEYLIKKGVKKNRVLTKAFGGTQPITTERTAEAKAKNRRVEVRVLGN
ncbi:MAG: OOP family OmpA-OmpF porin [Cyclobacteriaceae bacterium]|jgi:OOP family OmpA-OmpF porin